VADADTEDKRRTAPVFFLTTVNPVADGTVGLYDRIQAIGIYGFNVESVVGGTVVPQAYIIMNVIT
jgi:hypothetical protein